MATSNDLDALDVRLLELLHTHPRAGVLELSRLAGVARATITARLARMESLGVITGYGPEVDVVAAGYPLQALATLEIGRAGWTTSSTCSTRFPVCSRRTRRPAPETWCVGWRPSRTRICSRCRWS